MFISFDIIYKASFACAIADKKDKFRELSLFFFFGGGGGVDLVHIYVYTIDAH